MTDDEVIKFVNHLFYLYAPLQTPPKRVIKLYLEDKRYTKPE